MIFALILVLVLIERVYPIHRMKLFKKGTWVDFVWYFFIQSIFLQVCIFSFLDEFLEGYKVDWVAHWPLALRIVLFILIIDFTHYWIHRLSHSWAFLWRFHQIHHSSKEVNTWSTFRMHFVESTIGHAVQFGVVICLGANMAVMPYLIVFQTVTALFSHSNIKVRLGPIAYIFNTPEMHQWHHSNYAHTRHINFANQLAIWDWIFGTAYNPENAPDEFGLDYDFPKNYFLQNIYALFPFNVKKWESNPTLSKILNLRVSLVQKIIGIFKR